MEYALPIVLVGVLGYIAVVKTWFFHDDWVFLADAAGMADRDQSFVRIVSYDWYWRIFYPVFGLHQWGWALTRLVMHGVSSLLTARLAGHAGLDRPGQILAGMIFAASPAAFECLYWATGAVELLGVVFALGALERWLAGTARSRWTALALTALAIGCKEAGLLLPVVFAADLIRHRHWRSPLWFGLGGVVLIGVAGVLLMLGDFETADAYGVDLRNVPRNFLVYGSWLATPVVLMKDATLMTTAGLLTGAAVWLLWGWLARRYAIRGRPALLICLVLAVLSIMPATVLGNHAVPRYLYGPFAAFAVSLAALIYPKHGPSGRTLVLLTAMLWLVAWSGVEFRRQARYPMGREYHRLVYKNRVSSYLWIKFREAGLRPDARVVIVQDPSTDDAVAGLLQDAMGGELALKFLNGRGATITWVKGVPPEDIGAAVFRTKDSNLFFQDEIATTE